MHDVCGELEAQILDTMNANVHFEEDQDRDAREGSKLLVDKE